METFIIVTIVVLTLGAFGAIICLNVDWSGPRRKAQAAAAQAKHEARVERMRREEFGPATPVGRFLAAIAAIPDEEWKLIRSAKEGWMLTARSAKEATLTIAQTPRREGTRAYPHFAAWVDKDEVEHFNHALVAVFPDVRKRLLAMAAWKADAPRRERDARISESL